MQRLSLVLIFFWFCSAGLAQNQLLDSLYARYQNQSLSDSLRYAALIDYSYHALHNDPETVRSLLEKTWEVLKEDELLGIQTNIILGIGMTYSQMGDTEKAREYYEQAFSLASENDFLTQMAQYYLNSGALYMDINEPQKAIEHLRKSIEYTKMVDQDDMLLTHNTLHNIAVCYSMIDKPDKALEYYNESLAMRRQLNDSLSMLYSYVNIGVLHMNQERLDSARFHFERSREIAADLNDLMVQGFAEINLAIVHKDLGNRDDALMAVRAARKAFSESDNVTMEQATYLTEALVYNGFQEWDKAIDVALQYADTSEISGNIGYLGRKYNVLYEAYKGVGNYDLALEYLEMRQQHEKNMSLTATAADLENFEAEKRALQDSIKYAIDRGELVEGHQKTVAKKDRQKNFSIAGGLVAFIVAAFVFLRWRKTRKEKAASEKILNNILPAEVSAEIKEKGSANAKQFEDTTILFSDFKGFTSLSEKLSPEELVAEIDTCFKAFDAITGKYGVEKIKTIGDAYMAAGGLPNPSEGNTANVVKAALEMQEYIKDRKTKLEKEGKPGFEMRIGIHTGTVVAGIVGVKKFQYDVWGDTVNTASRMESSGEACKVNISQSTYDRIKDDPAFTFEYRGKIEAKGKGLMDMYFVDSLTV